MLYKLIRSLALVAAVLMAFLLTTTGQAGGAVELAEDKSCGLTWQPQPDSHPKVSGPIIYIEVLVDCIVPPTRHDLTLQLQRRDTDGSWVTQTAQTSKEIPSPRLTVRAAAECRAGVFRGLVHVEGSLQSSDFTFTDFSQLAAISAQDCK